jgi:isocitrate/isopropylmalate dehydrogenase
MARSRADIATGMTATARRASAVQHPSATTRIVTDNLFGDILTDFREAIAAGSVEPLRPT